MVNQDSLYTVPANSLVLSGVPLIYEVRMKIDGKQLADSILSTLREEVTSLTSQGILPALAVILVGNNSASLSYINQKKKAAESIGALLEFSHLPEDTTPRELAHVIEKFNADPGIYGIIIQRPLPKPSDEFAQVLATVSPEKDVDGFVSGSQFPVPVARAVEHILRFIWERDTNAIGKSFIQWLEEKKILVVGRGETAGKPIAEYLHKLSARPRVAHSKTTNARQLLKESDIVIACVGKPNLITSGAIKRGAILISVGIMRDDAGKLRGDYEESDIETVASYYTPTPSGVGPINVACLMENLITATGNSVD